MRNIAIYDTTLRDGAQAVDINLTAEDKMRIALKLDELGVAYIEGGWPGSNPTDKSFFVDVANYRFKNARIAAFGSTHNPKTAAGADPNLTALVDSKAPVLTIFGKTWDRHATEALGVSTERNLELISGSLGYLRSHCQELFFDAEHFFDGYKANPDYALACLAAAHQAGADVLVLCDTNGGTLPSDLRTIFETAALYVPQAKLGIHAHNDADMAVANSLTAVQAGAVQVQGTMNGYGERCGNANLCSIIPTLEIKLGCRALPDGRLTLLSAVSHFVDEVANKVPFGRQPYVGESAFAHKGGIHVSAVNKNSLLYEHISPDLVGNTRAIVLSDMAGQSNVLFKAEEYGIELEKGSAQVLEILSEVKEKESRGYEYSAAEASFELLMRRIMGLSRRYFSLVTYRVLDWKQSGCEEGPGRSHGDGAGGRHGRTHGQHRPRPGQRPGRCAAQGPDPVLPAHRRDAPARLQSAGAHRHQQGRYGHGLACARADNLRRPARRLDHHRRSDNVIEASWQAPGRFGQLQALSRRQTQAGQSLTVKSPACPAHRSLAAGGCRILRPLFRFCRANRDWRWRPIRQHRARRFSCERSYPSLPL